MANKKIITREEAIELYSNMSNDELMDKFMEYSVGDDWAGDYTTEGLLRWDVISNEMLSRLKRVGFLTENYML